MSVGTESILPWVRCWRYRTGGFDVCFWFCCWWAWWSWNDYIFSWFWTLAQMYWVINRVFYMYRKGGVFLMISRWWIFMVNIVGFQYLHLINSSLCTFYVTFYWKFIYFCQWKHEKTALKSSVLMAVWVFLSLLPTTSQNSPELKIHIMNMSQDSSV